ncbi:response regulator [uncultured Desulfosarcina sp.]|uniref:response regulator n=1 Tax=uncultured Desulfosarcina sp. TaxID=218289 RepID=UPI0029C69FE3|nr:response regulator [uncultured Desulfosarcina sp.]
MPEGLDVIVVDDDPDVCELVSTIIKRFYTWGKVRSFTDSEEATNYCLGRDIGVAIFVVDVFLGGASGFYFLDAINKKFPTAHADAIIITGNASDDIVNMCVASDVNHLLEKPVKPYALQLAVRAIAEKYLKFAKRLFKDPEFAKSIADF